MLLFLKFFFKILILLFIIQMSSNKSYYHITCFYFLFDVNVNAKFEIKDDIQVPLMRRFSDSIVIEFDWWIHICIRFTGKK